MAQTSQKEPTVNDSEILAKKSPAKKKSWEKSLIEWIIVIAVALGASQAIRTWVFSSYSIPSGSMQPTLMIGDKIIVNKLSYSFHGVNRGDIVVFANPPADKAEPPGTDLVKRVIGLPGETIWSNPNGTIYINGKPISQPWLVQSAITNPGPRICSVLVYSRSNQGSGSTCDPLVIPANEYFVMGDNRGDSEDSRYFGPIQGSLIIGKVDAIIWANGHPVYHGL